MEPSDEPWVKMCHYCLAPLVGRQTKWCSPLCQKTGARWAWIQKVYGLSEDDYAAILREQELKCPICLRKFKSTPHIDHEHGAHVRGIVCAYCNTRLIGRLKDHETAQRLADYLREPPAVKALGREVIAPGRPKRKRRATKRNGKDQARPQG